VFAAQLEDIHRWNATDAAFPRTTIHEAFLLAARTTPDTIAAVYEDEQMTFDALNRRSNQLARYLIRVGVSHGDKIALCMYRSLDLLVAILAIFKAGCSYVPIEPTYPLARKQFMVQDSGSRLLLTHKQVKIESNVPSLHIDKYSGLIVNELDLDVDFVYNPENLAYTIYTSGSTGTIYVNNCKPFGRDT
jgi:non-ribosomal peptide synthetase component F